MALTYTPTGEIGSKLPSFELPLINGSGQFSNSDLVSNRPTLVMFICNHCPYVKAIEERLIEIGRDYGEKVNIAAICSNDPTDYDEDSFSNLKARAEEMNYTFSYLHDESQDVAKSFGAVCTPDFFAYDSNQSLAYRGRLDDSWKNPEQVKKQELRQALDILLSGKSDVPDQIPSMGCSIKWSEE